MIFFLASAFNQVEWYRMHLLIHSFLYSAWQIIEKLIFDLEMVVWQNNLYSRSTHLIVLVLSVAHFLSGKSLPDMKISLSDKEHIWTATWVTVCVVYTTTWTTTTWRLKFQTEVRTEPSPSAEEDHEMWLKVLYKVSGPWVKMFL